MLVKKFTKKVRQGVENMEGQIQYNEDFQQSEPQALKPSGSESALEHHKLISKNTFDSSDNSIITTVKYILN